MRTLVRYFVLTAMIVGLGWASMTVKIGDRTAVGHLRGPAKQYWAKFADWSTSAEKKKPAPKAKPKKTKKKAVAKKKPARPVREIPPDELQSEPEAEKRVALLAAAARSAEARTHNDANDKKKPKATRITRDQKNALDALLTNGQSSD